MTSPRGDVLRSDQHVLDKLTMNPLKFAACSAARSRRRSPGTRCCTRPLVLEPHGLDLTPAVVFAGVHHRRTSRRSAHPQPPAGTRRRQPCPVIRSGVGQLAMPMVVTSSLELREDCADNQVACQSDASAWAAADGVRPDAKGGAAGIGAGQSAAAGLAEVADDGITQQQVSRWFGATVPASGVVVAR